MMDAATHCVHAGPSGGGVCGNVNFRNDMPTAYRRVDRMGMPAVSTALVGTARKNAYNDGDPAGDMGFAGDFIGTLTALHTALDDDFTALNLAPCSMSTMTGGLPSCLGQEYAPGRTVAEPCGAERRAQHRHVRDGRFPQRAPPAGPGDRRDPRGALPAPRQRHLRDGELSALTLATRPLNPAMNDRPFLMTFPYLGAARPLSADRRYPPARR